MSTTASLSARVERRWPGLLEQLPTIPEVGASLLRTIVVALFVLTFLMEPFLIPSESMERTLLVGDFMLSNRQEFAPSDRLGRWILPYRTLRRGDVVVFYHSDPELLVKRVVAVPGDRLRIVNGQVFVNEAPLKEPYAWFAPSVRAVRDDFPPVEYTDPAIDPSWWKQIHSLTQDGELVVPPGEYFVLGDNRLHSDDSRYWGFVPRKAILAKPMVIYFSLKRAVGVGRMRANVKLENTRDFAAKLTGFARWDRIFRVVH